MRNGRVGWGAWGGVNKRRRLLEACLTMLDGEKRADGANRWGAQRGLRTSAAIFGLWRTFGKRSQERKTEAGAHTPSWLEMTRMPVTMGLCSTSPAMGRCAARWHDGPVPTDCPYTMSSSLGDTPMVTRWSYTARMSAYVSSSLGTPVLAPYLNTFSSQPLVHVNEQPRSRSSSLWSLLESR